MKVWEGVASMYDDSRRLLVHRLLHLAHVVHSKRTDCIISKGGHQRIRLVRGQHIQTKFRLRDPGAVSWLEMTAAATSQGMTNPFVAKFCQLWHLFRSRPQHHLQFLLYLARSPPKRRQLRWSLLPLAHLDLSHKAPPGRLLSQTESVSGSERGKPQISSFEIVFRARNVVEIAISLNLYLQISLRRALLMFPPCLYAPYPSLTLSVLPNKEIIHIWHDSKNPVSESIFEKNNSAHSTLIHSSTPWKLELVKF
jgi:hypothetical protein